MYMYMKCFSFCCFTSYALPDASQASGIVYIYEYMYVFVFICTLVNVQCKHACT